MSVTSMEALEALPVGASIEVAGHRTFVWTRTEQGWANGDSVLGSAMFTGHVAAGQVVDRTASEAAVGQWRRDGEVHYLVTSLTASPGYVTVMQFRRGMETPSPHRLRGPRVQRMGYSTDEELASTICNPTNLRWLATQMLNAQAQVTTTEVERDQRAQEVRVLKNRPEVEVIRPQVDVIAAALSQASEAVRVLGEVVRENTEF